MPTTQISFETIANALDRAATETEGICRHASVDVEHTLRKEARDLRDAASALRNASFVTISTGHITAHS